MQLHYVFVYGTLMEGLANFHIIRPYIRKIMPASIGGAALYHLPYGYPAVMLDGSQQRVQGELVEITDTEQALAILDRLEDFHGEGNAGNLYDRVLYPVQTAAGEIIDAYLYVWSRPGQLPLVGTLLPDGCWRSYIAK